MTDTGWDWDDWPAVEATEILPGLFMGGTADGEYLGCALAEDHYSFTSNYDVVVTLFADAQPAPWGVEEMRYGFPDDELTVEHVCRVLDFARHAHMRWAEGARVLVRCQQGVNRSGFLTALVLMRHGMTAADAIDLLRERRGLAVLNNASFESWLRDHAHGFVGRPKDAGSGDAASTDSEGLDI